MRSPVTHFARAGEADIAYSTVGDGPVDLVWAYGLMTHLELKWEEPALAAMLLRLTEFSRLILYDRRGCGLSDRGDRFVAPTLEERVSDIVAVLDAVGSDTASLLGVSEGCAVAALFASMHPKRTERIILYGGMSRMVSDPGHPWGAMKAPAFAAVIGPVIDHWGTDEGAAAMVELVAPSMAEDADYLSWFARQQRHSVSRDAVAAFLRTIAEYDVDDILPAIRVPTLVLHRTNDTAISLSSARHVASRIPGARLTELSGIDHLPYVGDSDAVVDAIGHFLDGSAELALEGRQLVTLLAADATDLSSRDELRRQLRRMGGDEVGVLSRGVMTKFDTATKAIRCGLSLVQTAWRRGEIVRVGVHTGECQVHGSRVSGPTTLLPPALVDVARPGEVLVSGTVRDLVPGSGIRFTGERSIQLRGLPGRHTILAVADPSTVAAATSGAPSVGSHMTNEFRLEGEIWTVVFESKRVALKDSKGMHDLRFLLREPRRERHVLDLWSEGATLVDHAALFAAGSVRPGRPTPVIDAVAKDRYRRRLAELDEVISDAAPWDVPDASEATAERDRLLSELANMYGVGDRVRRVPDEVERARKAVRRRIASALDRIETANPALGRHLRHSVHTGVYCSYDPERDLTWDTG